MKWSRLVLPFCSDPVGHKHDVIHDTGFDVQVTACDYCGIERLVVDGVMVGVR